MSDTIGFIYDEKFLLHTPPEGHPERPDRLRSLVQHLKQPELWQKDVLAVHTEEHLELVRQVCETGGGMLDEGDTHAVRESFGVAMLAAGAVRPPGHHAVRDRPMGFCLFNNIRSIPAREREMKEESEKGKGLSQSVESHLRELIL